MMFSPPSSCSTTAGWSNIKPFSVAMKLRYIQFEAGWSYLHSKASFCFACRKDNQCGTAERGVCVRQYLLQAVKAILCTE